MGIKRRVLTLIRGLPGSGKTTLARIMMNADNYGNAMRARSAQHFEADMFFDTGNGYVFDGTRIGEAHDWCKLNTEMAMRAGTSAVYVSNTFTTEREMKPYFDLAERFNYKLQVIDLCGSFGSVHDVPEETIDKMRVRYQENPKWLR
jgi:predicted kinase